jgi:hypothetical protein
MRNIIYYSFGLLIAALFMFSCQTDSETKENTDEIVKEDTKQKIDTLIKNRESNAVLDVPESVIYYPEKDVLFISNVAGEPTEKNGNGFISELKLSGEILSLKWTEGLDAPKGMGIYDNMLYVTDIDELVIIDIENAAISEEIDVAGSQFLNDIAIDEDGRVYISDLVSGYVYRYAGNEVTLWLSDSLLEETNGLYVRGDYLYMGTKNAVFKANRETADFEKYIDQTGPIDGLEAFDDKRFIISDWVGNIHLVSPDADKKLLLSTVADSINAADIQYLQDKKQLFVPTFFDNRLMIYDVRIK